MNWLKVLQRASRNKNKMMLFHMREVSCHEGFDDYLKNARQQIASAPWFIGKREAVILLRDLEREL
tara:strand:+ start:327 stop:524 length:198 start_codon:yes stop_codon:yes gene_type:complete